MGRQSGPLAMGTQSALDVVCWLTRSICVWAVLLCVVGMGGGAGVGAPDPP